MRLAALLVLALATPATAESDLTRLQRWLWPPHLPAPVEAHPVPSPIVPELSRLTHVPPIPPPAILSPEVPAAARTAAPRRPQKPRGAKTRAADDSGPDLPWPCWLVRAHAAGKTRAELEAEGRRHGITLTPKQRRQAAACLAGG